MLANEGRSTTRPGSERIGFVMEFSPFDLLNFELVSSPRLSPACGSVAYVHHTIDPDTNSYVANIHTWRNGELSSLRPHGY